MIINGKKTSAVMIVIVMAILMMTKSCHRISAGYVGVVYSPNGGVQEKVLTQGYNLINPFKNVTEYTVGTEQAYLSADEREGSEDNDSFIVPTSDGKMVNVDLEYSYRYDENKVAKIFTRFKGKSGELIQNTYTRVKIKAYVSEVTSKFSVLDIYGSKRADLNLKAYQHIKEKFAKDGIIIESVNFSRIGLDKATATVIQQRVNTQQELERQKIEKQKAQIEAERNAIQEQGKANVKLIQAKAEAERILTVAKAQSKANDLKKKSLSDELIRYEQTLRWNGELPQVTSGGTPIIDIRN
ncbi:prohibitin family protein [Psychrilyobacter atlanticus]|uniref:prohibitin family protein n=1 Tax=Psychrilyobacter atlanticus TaxID=271091 RepID=UPI0003F9E2EA|nr:prohibitin family protein [Psychrilyobacter atlanticus]